MYILSGDVGHDPNDVKPNCVININLLCFLLWLF